MQRSPFAPPHRQFRAATWIDAVADDGEPTAV
jgi:hypothetical protein